MNFTFKLDMFIDHLNVSNYFKAGNHDLDLQAQIGL